MRDSIVPLTIWSRQGLQLYRLHLYSALLAAMLSLMFLPVQETKKGFILMTNIIPGYYNTDYTTDCAGQTAGECGSSHPEPHLASSTSMAPPRPWGCSLPLPSLGSPAHQVMGEQFKLSFRETHNLSKGLRPVSSDIEAVQGKFSPHSSPL